ncbi:hypothetical protein LguiB_020731 [Lonicera macranthoides]
MGNCFSCEDEQHLPTKVPLPNNSSVESRTKSNSATLPAKSPSSNGSTIMVINKNVKDLRQNPGNSDLDIFTYEEMQLSTKHFRPDQVLGEGGFGIVYRGVIDENVRLGYKKTQVAIKELDPEGIQGDREWLAEVNYLGQLRHPNLVKLIGYCCDDDHRLLVYEYMASGSLEKHLFRRVCATLTWSRRMKIALDVAKGLAFLHGAERPIIYRDFKTSNILLDVDFNAKLSDFGLAKDGPMGDQTHVSTRVMGTYGYAAPEYVMTGIFRRLASIVAMLFQQGCMANPAIWAAIFANTAAEDDGGRHLTARSDVYGFGVVLLEMLIGRRAMDKSRPSREHNLVEWARPILNHSKKLLRILDPRMEGQYSSKTAIKAANLAYQCLSQNPKGRPAMNQVVEILESLQSREEEEAILFQAGSLTLYEVPKEKKKSNETTREGKREKDSGTSPNAGGTTRKAIAVGVNGRSKSEPPKDCDLYSNIISSGSPSPDSIVPANAAAADEHGSSSSASVVGI